FLYLASLFLAPGVLDISPLSLHDALPIYPVRVVGDVVAARRVGAGGREVIAAVDEVRVAHHQRHVVARRRPEPSLAEAAARHALDRKSTRLNSSHVKISYAVFCLKKKNS